MAQSSSNSIDLAFMTGETPEQASTTGTAPNSDLLGGSETPSTAVSLIEDHVAPKKSKKGKTDVLPPDQLSTVISDIEKLTAADALALANKLTDGGDFDTFKLGGVFSVVLMKKYFAEYGFKDFHSWVESAYGIKYRKAMYLAGIYDQVVELDLNWDQIKYVGWTKLKTLLNPALNLITAENVGEWIKKAEGMTVLQLEGAVSQKKLGTDGNAEENDGSKVTTMTFKLHPDQKDLVRNAIEKAKDVSGAEGDTKALEYMAAEFMGKPVPVNLNTQATDTSALGGSVTGADLGDTSALTAAFKKLGYGPVLEAFEAAFPDVELSVTLPSDEM